MSDREAATLPPYPDGWYAVGFSDELPPGAVRIRPFMGGEIVLFRGRSGVAAATDAHCPHLGAHLGHGGTVEGDTLRCPFHGFCFDRAGACVSTAYGGRPPRARLRTHRLLERSGVLLVHHDAAGREPTWEVPELEPGDGWSPFLRRQWRFRGHPQETTENSVDVGHLAVVHGYRSIEELSPLELRGPHLTVRYAVTRRYLPSLSGASFRMAFTIHAHGLGYSLAEAEVPRFGFETRQLVLVTPEGPGRATLRIALSVRRTRARRLETLLPRGLASRLIAGIGMLGFAHDVAQDIVIWEHKRYTSPPGLAEGDGPIGAYRRWARQFYPGSSGAAWTGESPGDRA